MDVMKSYHCPGRLSASGRGCGRSAQVTGEKRTNCQARALARATLSVRPKYEESKLDSSSAAVTRVMRLVLTALESWVLT
jgi:hypothetical protein